MEAKIEKTKLEKRKCLYGFETIAPDKRRTNRDSPGSYNVKALWQRSHEIIGLALQGHKQKDIATLLGITPVTVSNVLNSELGENKLSELRKERDGEYIDVSKRISELSEKATKIYEEILDSPNATLTLKKATADTVLMDLGGHRAPTKVDTRSMHLTASTEEVEEFKRLGLKAAKESGYLIELDDETKEVTDDSLEKA